MRGSSKGGTSVLNRIPHSNTCSCLHRGTPVIEVVKLLRMTFVEMVYRNMKRALVVFMTLLPLLCAQASATLPTAVHTIATSPIRIDRCISGLRDTSVGNTNYYLDFGAMFTNTSSSVVTAVRLRFDVFNSFNEHLRTVYGTDDELSMNPNDTKDDIVHNTRMEQMTTAQGESFATFLPTWEFVNINDTAAKFVCSVDTVLFQNQNQWHAPTMRARDLATSLRYTKAENGTFYKSGD